MKRDRVGGSRRTYSWDEAIARAGLIFRRTGVVVSITEA